jgi:hypothetical protein
VRPGVCLITAASRARLYQRLPLNDDGTVMKVSDQALVEFAVLSLSGIVWSVVTALLVTDYRGTLTSYTHRCWLMYQRPWYQRTFLRTASSRARYAGENRLRRTSRIVAVIGFVLGVFVVSIEFSALVTGHVR